MSEDGDEQDVEDALRVAIDVQEELLAFLNRTKDSWRLVGRQVEFNDPTLAADFNRIMAKAPRR